LSELTIKRLDEKPKVKAKTTSKKGEIRKLLEKFDNEKMKYAEIPATKEHSIRGLKISIGRILKRDNRTDIAVFESEDGKSIILERK
jgi:hypothetical protein